MNRFELSALELGKSLQSRLILRKYFTAASRLQKPQSNNRLRRAVPAAGCRRSTVTDQRIGEVEELPDLTKHDLRAALLIDLRQPFLRDVLEGRGGGERGDQLVPLLARERVLTGGQALRALSRASRASARLTFGYTPRASVVAAVLRRHQQVETVSVVELVSLVADQGFGHGQCGKRQGGISLQSMRSLIP